jgi:hypothetical protein
MGRRIFTLWSMGARRLRLILKRRYACGQLTAVLPNCLLVVKSNGNSLLPCIPDWTLAFFVPPEKTCEVF